VYVWLLCINTYHNASITLCVFDVINTFSSLILSLKWTFCVMCALINPIYILIFFTYFYPVILVKLLCVYCAYILCFRITISFKYSDWRTEGEMLLSQGEVLPTPGRSVTNSRANCYQSWLWRRGRSVIRAKCY